MRSPSIRLLVVVGALGVGTTAALAFPWDLDLIDSLAVEPYEAPMAVPAEGTVAQSNLLSPREQVPRYARASAEGRALVTLLDNDEATLARGRALFDIYCTPCHGHPPDFEPGTVAQPERFEDVVHFAGETNPFPTRTDGHIYLTIRNGGGRMPAKGWALSDGEMWSVVAWIRSNDVFEADLAALAEQEVALRAAAEIAARRKAETEAAP